MIPDSLHAAVKIQMINLELPLILKDSGNMLSKESTY